MKILRGLLYWKYGNIVMQDIKTVLPKRIVSLPNAKIALSVDSTISSRHSMQSFTCMLLAICTVLYVALWNRRVEKIILYQVGNNIKHAAFYPQKAILQPKSHRCNFTSFASCNGTHHQLIDHTLITMKQLSLTHCGIGLWSLVSRKATLFQKFDLIVMLAEHCHYLSQKQENMWVETGQLTERDCCLQFDTRPCSARLRALQMPLCKSSTGCSFREIVCSALQVTRHLTFPTCCCMCRAQGGFKNIRWWTLVHFDNSSLDVRSPGFKLCLHCIQNCISNDLCFVAIREQKFLTS